MSQQMQLRNTKPLLNFQDDILTIRGRSFGSSPEDHLSGIISTLNSTSFNKCWMCKGLRAHSPVDLVGIPLDPSPNGGMIHGEAALLHHLFEIAVRELVSAISPSA